MWQDVFLNEVERRRLLYKKNPDLFKKVHRANPKGLRSLEKCQSHVWVPATHVWIHDQKAKVAIEGVKRRGFTEARPYLDEGYRIIPQVCWDCDATRDLELLVLSVQEMQAKLEAARPKKERKTKYIIEDSFDELLADLLGE